MVQDQRSASSSSAAKPTALRDHIFALLDQILSGPRDEAALTNALRVLGKWRGKVIETDIMQRSGGVIAHGPFAGMIYSNTASEGATAARLLGCYEASLAPIIEDIVARAYACVMDVGCAEGYYAVGLARRMPNTQIIARDTEPKALRKCAALAQANGVAGQISYGGAVAHRDFDICLGTKTLVICDIEGAEAQLLNPILAPGLRVADILVESHDCLIPNLSANLAQRFAASHDVQIFDRSLDVGALPDWMHSYSDMDRLLALWEWRAGPTPWLWMTAKPTPDQDSA
jgi:hypothetical protein